MFLGILSVVGAAIVASIIHTLTLGGTVIYDDAWKIRDLRALDVQLRFRTACTISATAVPTRSPETGEKAERKDEGLRPSPRKDRRPLTRLGGDESQALRWKHRRRNAT